MMFLRSDKRHASAYNCTCQVSQYLSGLATDIVSCLRQVRAGGSDGMQCMDQHFTLMQSYIGRVMSRAATTSRTSKWWCKPGSMLSPVLSARAGRSSKLRWLDSEAPRRRIATPAPRPPKPLPLVSLHSRNCPLSQN